MASEIVKLGCGICFHHTVPAAKVCWRDAWPAGILTAFLIGLSRYLIQAYLSFSTTSEVYGAAGSLVALLIWIYITSMNIVLAHLSVERGR